MDNNTIDQQANSDSNASAPSFISELNKGQIEALSKIPFRKTLLNKGLVFVSFLIAYASLLAYVVLNEWDVPLKQLEEYQRIEHAENALVQADIAAFHVITALFIDLNEQDIKAIVNYFSVLQKQYEVLDSLFPDKAASYKTLVDLLPKVLEQPSKDNLSVLHRKLTQAKIEIDSLMAENRHRRGQLIEQYREHSERLIITALTLAIIGLALIGTITSLFFAHISRDINNTRLRVRQIVEGFRGAPLVTTRQDELGQLIVGVNQMANDLDEREKELELERRRTFYQEKMIAIESLAGGIAHEIGNPITCISGLAHEIQAITDDSVDEAIVDLVASIVDYSDGLGKITRDLSVIASPASDEIQLFDLNELIANTCNLLHFDQRWEEVEFEIDLNHQLPALNGIKDQFSLLVNNLLENALDAFQDYNGDKYTITVTTSHDNDKTTLTIKDNGRGMDVETLEKSVEPFFSTKPVGQGTGLGLALCWSIVTYHQGDIKIESAKDKGTQVSVIIPHTEKCLCESYPSEIDG